MIGKATGNLVRSCTWEATRLGPEQDANQGDAEAGNK